MDALFPAKRPRTRAEMDAEEIVRRRGMYKFQPFSFRKLPPRTDVIPLGRSGHRIVSDNSCVYSFGGFNPESDEGMEPDFNSKLFRELWKFNIGKQSWERLDHFSHSMPAQLVSNAVLLEGKLMFVHGGTAVPFGMSNTSETYVANLKSGNSFCYIPAGGQIPLRKYGQAIVADKQRLYVVGGSTGLDYLLDVHCLDLKTLMWEELFLTTSIDDEPCGRYRHEIALLDEKILVFGGGTNTDVFSFYDIPAFDLRTNTWDMIPTFRCDRTTSCLRQWFPPPRRCHGCVYIPGDEKRDPEVVICGGFDGLEVLSDMWRLNLRTFDWYQCENSLPDPVYFHSTCMSPNGQMFLFGGIRELIINNTIVSSRRNQVYSMWAKIPSLKEICWEAVRHYCPDMNKYRNSVLLRCGVPPEFVERLENDDDDDDDDDE